METPTEPPSDPDGSGAPYTGALARGCDWALIYDAVQPGGNNAFPDTGARYWAAVVAEGQPAGTRLRANGSYPDARYSALFVYDGALRAFDALADYELAPDSGLNPFLDQTRLSGREYGDDYTAFVRLNVAAPEAREANTLYRPPPSAAASLSAQRTLVVYRTYLPEGGNQGRVRLPELRLETPQGDLPLDNDTDAQACAQIAAALRQDGARVPGSANVIDPTLPRLFPTFQRFEALIGDDGAAQGVGYNEHNGFLYTKTDDTYGALLLVRGRAQSYTTQSGGTPQVRYWSLCAAGFNSQKVYDCSSDRDTPLDDSGYYTLVVSRDSTRPAVLDGAEGFAWIARGTERIGVITQRELLAHPSFAEATVNITGLATAAQVKGEFLPLATYCSEAVFASAVAMGPAAAFAACDASRRVLQ